MQKENEPRLMKDALSTEALQRLSRSLKRGTPAFPDRAFFRDCMLDLNRYELKGRVHHVIAQLQKHLPAPFLQARPMVLRACNSWEKGENDDPLRGFAAWPLIDWVAVAGLHHPVQSLEMLRRMTGMFSAEFALRPFLELHQELSLKTLKEWTTDPNEHVRRLVSEATRPRLPWGAQLKSFMTDPSPCLPLLDTLKDDPSEYVRRSVANHLNDISKDNPRVVIQLAKAWQKGASEERKWIVRHGLRTLVKAGNPQALSALGFTTSPQINATLKVSNNKLSLGDTLVFDIKLASTTKKKQKLVVDYAIVYQKSGGKTSRKVFKMKQIALSGGETFAAQKSQTLKNFSTRKHYPGTHTVELVVSGETVATRRFELHV